jgi:Amt family ammonium transporter
VHGGISAIFVMYWQTKKWDTTAIINGFLAGLVGITCPCYWVTNLGAAAIGAVAGVIVIGAMELLEHFRIDDPVGAWPVHGACGIWGTLSLGLFASGQFSAAGSSPFGIPSIVPGRLKRSPACSTAAGRRFSWRRSSAARLSASRRSPAPW